MTPRELLARIEELVDQSDDLDNQAHHATIEIQIRASNPFDAGEGVREARERVAWLRDRASYARTLRGHLESLAIEIDAARIVEEENAALAWHAANESGES